MRNLFETDTYNNIISRIEKLTPQSHARWGKMSVSQMLAHCQGPVKIALTDKKLKRAFIGYILGPLIKKKLYNDSPWKQNLPTSPHFIIKDEREFEKEKKSLKELLNKFYAAGPEGISKHPHPMFGKFTPEQLGMSIYKHMDHHLIQFGV